MSNPMAPTVVNIIFAILSPSSEKKVFKNYFIATRCRNCLFYHEKRPKSIGVKHFPLNGLSKPFLFVTQSQAFLNPDYRQDFLKLGFIFKVRP